MIGSMLVCMPLSMLVCMPLGVPLGMAAAPGPDAESTHLIPIVVIALYIALLYGITWWSRRLSRGYGLVGYLLAGRNLPFYITAAMLTGLAVGGASTIGVAEQAK